ncbi:hypothetical protein EDEG_04226, partial [Edhazardia aedis USNM 41457]
LSTLNSSDISKYENKLESLMREYDLLNAQVSKKSSLPMNELFILFKQKREFIESLVNLKIESFEAIETGFKMTCKAGSAKIFLTVENNALSDISTDTPIVNRETRFIIENAIKNNNPKYALMHLSSIFSNK